MARPKKKIDTKQVETLARIQCTMKEIAAVCQCSVATLERRFADAIKEAQESGRSSLRRAQWKSALGGNTTMQIWLGKQHLGQRDSRTEFTGDMTVYEGKDKSAKAELGDILFRRATRLGQKGLASGDNGS